MKHALIIAALSLATSGCGGAGAPSDPQARAGEAAASNDAEPGEVVVTMAGETFVVAQVDWQVIRIEDAEGERRYMLMAQDLPLTLNLNVTDAAIRAAILPHLWCPAAISPTSGLI